MLSIQTEFGYDVVKIFDGDEAKAKVLATMSGSGEQDNNRNKDIIISSKEIMKVTFTSDGTTNMKGFQATVAAVHKTGTSETLSIHIVSVKSQIFLVPIPGLSIGPVHFPEPRPVSVSVPSNVQNRDSF